MAAVSADDTFKRIFLNENGWNENEKKMMKMSLKYVPKVRISNISAVDQIMASRRQAIFLTNDGLSYSRIFPSPGHPIARSLLYMVI